MTDVFGDEATPTEVAVPAPEMLSSSMKAADAVAFIQDEERTEDELIAFVVGEKRASVLKAYRVLFGGSAPAVDVPSGAAVKGGAVRYLVEIDEQEGMTNSQEVGVNGKVYQIKRGEPVEINEECMEVLRNSVAERIVQTDTGHGVESRRQKYTAVPYRVLREIHP